MNADLYNIGFLLNANKLALNLTKTKSMLIGSNRKMAKMSSMSVSIFDCNFDNVNTFKYLEIKLDSDFTWTERVYTTYAY